jgi:uncharacterized protein YjbI with pentapeptide repeats
MKAHEVLSHYAAGERDFRRINLCGQSFQGQNLADANFTEVNIKGANFNDAILTGADFSGAEAGVEQKWLLIQLLIITTMLILAGVLSALIGIFFADLLFNNTNNESGNGYFLNGIIITLVIATTFYTITRYGFTSKKAIVAFGMIVSLACLSCVINLFKVGVPVSTAVAFSAIFGAPIAVIIISVIVFITAVAISSLMTSYNKLFVFFGIVITIAISIILAGFITEHGAFYDFHAKKLNYVNKEKAKIIGGAISLISYSFSIYCNKSAFKKNSNNIFSTIRICGIALRAIGGTSFRGADLSYANFSFAVLPGTNFNYSKRRSTILKWVTWRNAKNMEYSIFSYDSPLINPEVRDLLISRNGCSKSYTGANLRYINLDEFNLEGANLKCADISYSTLRNANLKNINLTKSHALMTNFTGACFTGACLEAWNIDNRTNLEQVGCDYMYLLRGKQERRPSGDDLFAPEEFTKLFKELLIAMDRIFRSRAEPQAQIEKNDELHESHNFSPNLTLNVQVNAESKNMNNTNDSSQSVNITGDITGSTINLGEISGDVTNTINQLPDTFDPNQPNIKELLIQLQTAVETEPTLPETDKSDLLEQVKNLAEAKQTKEPIEKEGLVRKAKKIFEATLKGLPDTAKIVEACSKLLPLILKVLGSPV